MSPIPKPSSSLQTHPPFRKSALLLQLALGDSRPRALQLCSPGEIAEPSPAEYYPVVSVSLLQQSLALPTWGRRSGWKSIMLDAPGAGELSDEAEIHGALLRDLCHQIVSPPLPLRAAGPERRKEFLTKISPEAPR